MNDGFKLMFDQVRSGVVWVQRNGTVRYANKAAVQLTPLMLGSPFMDPVVERTVKSAGENMLTLPFSFEFTTQEENGDSVKAVIIPAPVGDDLMLVMNNVSEERWYASALENLIFFVQAEMSTPILELAKRLPRVNGLRRDGEANAELDAIVGNATDLAAKVGKLGDLMSMFGQSSIQRDERIVFNELVKKVLEEVAPLIEQRKVVLTIDGLELDLPAVYGSSLWLQKALSEYMEYTIRSAPVSALIDFSVQALGTRVVLRARNQGLFVSAQERRQAQAPMGVGAAKKPSRQGIGLALSQRILELHGGSVRIEDEFDSVDFVMEIPAGAPVNRNEQLAVEQAQRYAHDMSQLMARAARKKAPEAAPAAPLRAAPPVTKAG